MIWKNEGTQINIMSNTTEEKLTQNPVVDYFIRYFCFKLNINNLTNICEYVSQKVKEHSIVFENTKPDTLAVGIIYLVSCYMNLKITKNQFQNLVKFQKLL